MAWVPYLLLVVFVLLWGDADDQAGDQPWTDSLLPASCADVARNGTLERPARARPAQPDHADAAGDQAASAVRGAVRAELAERVGHGVLARRRSRRRSCSGSGRRQFVQAYVGDVQAAVEGDGHDRLDAGPGVSDELLGHDVDARACRSRRPAARFRSSARWSAGSGVFLTGSDTSANALFGNLQVVTANALHLNPVLTASVNSAAGVMGKMISVQSIAVAVAATGMSTRRREPAVPVHDQAQRPADGGHGRHFAAVRVRFPRRCPKP